MLLRLLAESGHDVHVVPTDSALEFVGRPTWEALAGHRVSTDVWTNAAEVEHVHLGRSIELAVIAPATAGSCDAAGAWLRRALTALRLDGHLLPEEAATEQPAFPPAPR